MILKAPSITFTLDAGIYSVNRKKVSLKPVQH